ncbi:M48 family metalloprotease [Nonlabens sp. SY33080]|uniref:M48 family metalloprotease n=1 Tax=Nonlabens sp. SY33080 TaxID=2719911 RepID=UPI001428C352|nr:M48 family metallopeptidase [Nonlabens sp. SY33080]
MTKKEIKISSEFKAQTTKAIMSITFFILTYVLMLVLAVGLTFLCIYGGIMLIAIRPMFITIALGIGLASLGVLVLIFLLKFIFRSHKVDRSHLFEITKEDEPELFDLIKNIVNQVGTTFPKKVYLSTDVNAAVFYDSSFWSMFLPVRKNLQIGLGLVNVVSKAELTAILSHEFGHFSQKTMKVGSYVYNVNQVIYNLLYDNESYDRLIQSWANVSGYFSIFVVLAVKIIEGVQAILRLVYEIVNKSYMGLSREMEFHADEIASSVTGFEPLKNSLLRMSIADHSFNYVLSFYDGKINSNQKSENLYKEHLFVMNFLAEDSNIKIENSLPKVTYEELNKFNKSKLVIKDQWASHPSTEDRIEMLEKTGMSSQETEFIPASKVFKNIIKTQKELTNKIFNNVQYQGEPISIPFEEFKNEYRNEFSKNSFSKMYNSYYDNKNPILFDINAAKSIKELVGIDEIFSDDMVDLVYTAIALQDDIETIKQIAEKAIPIKTFDYDGQKYKQKDSKELIENLDKELKMINDQIKQNDIRIFNFFKRIEQKAIDTPELENLYRDFFDFDKEFGTKYEPYIKLSNELQFVELTTPFDQIRSNFARIKPIEVKLKNGIKELLSDNRYQTVITKEIKDNFELYLSKQWQYFGNDKYFDNNLKIIFTAMNNYAFVLSRGYFLLKKRLLDYQKEILKTTHNNVYSV